MGYQIPETHARLRLGERYAGAEVVMTLDFPIGQALDLQGAEPGQAIDEMASLLIEWNIDDKDGKPVPCTAEGLRAQPFALVVAIFRGMLQAMQEVVTVDAPFEQPSSAGGTSDSTS